MPAVRRLQTTQHGLPVPVFTVSKELEHRSVSMGTRVYAHLGDIQHRSETVEFRLEQAPGAAATARLAT